MRPDLRIHAFVLSVASCTVTLPIVGLAGCATELTPRPGSPSTEAAPYVGVFTGKFVDGKPLYRFPTIEVVGSRNSVIDDELIELDRNQHDELLAAATRTKLDRLREELRAVGR